MLPYAKICRCLFDGSLRGHADEILVFVHLLPAADSNGMVAGHFKSVVDETGLSMRGVRAAIAALEQPDKESRSPEEEGRRLVRLSPSRDWGWRIVNHAKYRDLAGDDVYRRQARERMANYRERKPPVTQQLRNVTQPHANATATAYASEIQKGGAGGNGALDPVKLRLGCLFNRWAPTRSCASQLRA